MLSLPVLGPQTDDLLLLRTSHSQHLHLLRQHRSPSPPRQNNPQNTNEHHHQQHRPQSNAHKKPNPHTPHAQLLADENLLQHRKLAVRNFGSTWLRPPGVPKTLQAMREEEAEMLEQEELARQEQGLRDLRARQEVEELRARREAGEGMEGEMERDLDEEVPEGDALVGGEEGGEAMEDVTFNEESLVDGSRISHGADEGQRQGDLAAMEEAELTGAARDEEELGIDHERDLDDSVPEAGSYQHTDTELEDSSSSSDEDTSRLNDSFAAQSARRLNRPHGLPQGPPGPQGLQQVSAVPPPSISGALQDRIRAQTAAVGGEGDALTRSPGSLNLSSSLLGSDVGGSSPAAMVRGRAGGGAGRRRGRGRGG